MYMKLESWGQVAPEAGFAGGGGGIVCICS
jgi:hypothetical protein